MRAIIAGLIALAIATPAWAQSYDDIPRYDPYGSGSPQSDWSGTQGYQPQQPGYVIHSDPDPATGAGGWGLMATPSYHPDPATGAGGWNPIMR